MRQGYPASIGCFFNDIRRLLNRQSDRPATSTETTLGMLLQDLAVKHRALTSLSVVHRHGAIWVLGFFMPARKLSLMYCHQEHTANVADTTCMYRMHCQVSARKCYCAAAGFPRRHRPSPFFEAHLPVHAGLPQ